MQSLRLALAGGRGSALALGGFRASRAERKGPLEMDSILKCPLPFSQNSFGNADSCKIVHSAAIDVLVAV
jgi:hypothetical protein